MKLTHDDVRKVARLARLELEDTEIESLSADLSAILGYIEKLAELGTDNVEPTASVVTMQAALRADAVTNTRNPEKTVANAPATRNHYFVVPRIIE